MTKLQLLLIAASGVYLLVMIGAAYFLRATRKRVIGALIGGIAVSGVGVGIDCLAHTRGWWHYPMVESPYGPPLMYPVVILLFAALSLVGWRVTQRFGWRGQIVFLLVVTVLGTLRDYRVAAWLPEFIVFAPGVGIVLVDAACWTLVLVLAQAVMRWVAGPAISDPSAKEPATTRAD